MYRIDLDFDDDLSQVVVVAEDQSPNAFRNQNVHSSSRKLLPQSTEPSTEISAVEETTQGPSNREMNARRGFLGASPDPTPT